jgi:hypothetical protein
MLPLQFRQASSSIESWTGSQNPSLAGWCNRAAADLKRDLLSEAAFCGVEEYHIRALRLGPAGQLPYSGGASGSLATIDDGSTRAVQL